MNDELFNADNIPESSWFKFAKVGDKVGGRVGKVFTKAAQGQFPAQLGFTLLEAKGIQGGEAIEEAELNVGVKDNDFFRPRLSKVRVGDMLGFVFQEEIPTKIKGNSPAKSITPFFVPAKEEERAAFFVKYPELKTLADSAAEFANPGGPH